MTDITFSLIELLYAYCSIKLPLYMLRWQLSTLTLGPVISWRKWRKELKTDPEAKLVLFNKEDLITAFWANIIGSLIFFAVDFFIFTK